MIPSALAEPIRDEHTGEREGAAEHRLKVTLEGPGTPKQSADRRGHEHRKHTVEQQRFPVLVQGNSSVNDHCNAFFRAAPTPHPHSPISTIGREAILGLYGSVPRGCGKALT